MDRSLIIDKKKISYSDVGSGPVIVFLHGWMSSKNAYNWIIEYLSRGYRCISVDLPGFGKSDLVETATVKKIPSLVHKLIEDLKIKNYYMIGNSLGGTISIIYTNMYPNEVKKLVLISPFINFKQLSRLMFYLIRHVIPHIINSGVLSPLFKVIKAVVNFYSYKDKSNKQIILEFKKEKVKRRAIYAFSIAYELSNLNLYSYLSKIRKDVLFIYGKKDPLLSIKPLRPIFKVFNNIHLAIFEDVRHHMYTYNHEELAKKINLFFKGNTVN